MAHIGILQHFWCENAGIFESALVEAGHQIQYIQLFDGKPVPQVDAFDAWLIMGGPMNVDETNKYSFLEAELKLLSKLIAADRPLMGICLGAQLIARSAGAKVYAQRPKEIGLYDVELTPAANDDPLFQLCNNPQEAFQWHGDTFDLPAGAVHLARSERYENQAFRLGWRVYGLQFHLECTIEIVSNLRRACADELAELPTVDALKQFEDRLDISLAAQNILARNVVLRWAQFFD